MRTLDTIRNGLADAIRSAARGRTFRYRVADFAPRTDDAMFRHYAATGELVIWAGESDRTIYGAREVNWRFRAWHDTCHILSGVCNREHGPLGCFEPVAEYAVAAYQCIGLPDELTRLVQCEVSEQARYYANTGRFVDDQIRFTLDTLRARE